MSIYDKSSLVLIPSGTKTGKVYSQKPVSGDGDFTFTRSSAATRVNADGNIEKETQNLLLQSNTFDTTWTLTGSTLVGGQADKDGGTDAWKLTSSNTGQSFVKQVVSSSGVATYSVYAKAGTANFIVVYAVGGGDPRTFFDLQNGTTETAAHNITNKIEDVGNGWYRCSVIFNKTITDVRLFIADSDNVFNSGNGSSIYIQDAQLEQGLVARDYIETTTAAVEGGITDNVPRLDYTDSSCPALLLEPQRSNLIHSAEYYNSSSWYRTRSTITDNAATSPEGVDNASALIATAVSDDHFISTAPTITDDVYTYSVFLKEGGKSWARLWETNTNVFVDFNLDTGATGSTNGTIIDKGTEDFGDGWYRCYMTYDTGSAGAKNFRVYALEGDGDKSYLGDASTEEIYIYGAQVELGNYKTSYIPTYGSSVTRVAETNSVTGVSDLIGQTQGTFYWEGSLEENPSGTNMQLALSDGTTSQQIKFVISSSSTYVAAEVKNGGVQQFYNNHNIDAKTNRKYAIAYDSNDFAFYIDGTQIATDTSGSVPACSKISFDSGVSANGIHGNFKNVMLFPTRLTNAELADLTTL